MHFVLLLVTAAAPLLVACGESDTPGSVPATNVAATPPDMDAEVERLTAGNSPKALYLVANQFALGDGVEQDQKMAERLWKRACDLDHIRACSIYGSRLIGAGDYAGAEGPLDTAANGGDVDAMRNLVQLHSNSDWPGASFDKRLHWMSVLSGLE